MDALADGYRRFRAVGWPAHRARFEALAAGQSPQKLVIACSDSRVDPQMIFDAAPGELFVIRNVANLVPRYAPDSAYHGTSAAIEFAIKALGVRDIVVMGHGGCGGCRALIEPPDAPVGDFVVPWMALAAPARERALASGLAGAALHRACEHEVVKVSLENLLSFPWLRAATASGHSRLHGYWFDIASGELMRLGDDGAFAAVPV